MMFVVTWPHARGCRGSAVCQVDVTVADDGKGPWRTFAVIDPFCGTGGLVNEINPRETHQMRKKVS